MNRGRRIKRKLGEETIVVQKSLEREATQFCKVGLVGIAKSYTRVRLISLTHLKHVSSNIYGLGSKGPGRNRTFHRRAERKFLP